MGILKVYEEGGITTAEVSYTDQRSDGDTESQFVIFVKLLVDVVTQTNDPMGILKVRLESTIVQSLPGYTDQRSDGDTESPAGDGRQQRGIPLHRPTIRWGY